MKAKRCPELVEGAQKPVPVPGMPEPEPSFVTKRRMTWAALIKCVYEVDPLKCPSCGGTMKIISFIDQDQVIRKILKHCGLWKGPQPRAPPIQIAAPAFAEPALDYRFFEKTCA